MILDQIIAARMRRRAELPAPDESTLWSRAEAAAPALPLAAALRVPGHVSVLAEFKRRSPSAGVLREQGDVVVAATEYAADGARAMSVLTELDHFGGTIDDVSRVKHAVRALPILRKDFLVDERDLLESRAAGADAVLLIVRMLPDAHLAALVALARSLEMDALVEAHTPVELDRALAAGATLIGVNHRDLDTLQMDLELSRGARARVGKQVTLVAESGLKTSADVRTMAERGVDAVLIGESIMSAADPRAKLRELVNACT
jgi:indole-3-glycerol phosphate synthase